LQELKKDLTSETEEVSAIVNLYGTEPIIKFITLPYMPDDELNKTVKYQAQRFIVYDLEKMIIDYAVMNTFEEEKVKKINLALAATTKEAVYKQVEILKGAGFVPLAISVDCLAQFYLAREQGIFKTNGVVCFIDLGAKKAVIQIIDGGIPRFHRVCSTIGSWEINKVLKNTLKVNWEEAEKIKREFSLGLPEQEEYRMIIEKVMEDILIEIKRSLDYYIDISPQKTVERIILTGGGALLHNLDAYLKQHLEITVERFDPFKNINFSEKIKAIRPTPKDSLRFVTVMGLALEALG
ncbi:MAG: type IV pilus assembly protein PilM, partial [Candidatus Omnitrophota bacterium]